MNILSKLFRAGDAVKAIGDTIDNLVTSDDERLERKNESAKAQREFDLKEKELEIRREENTAKLETDILKSELGDTQNARAEHKMSIMPAVITVMLTVMVCGLLYVVVYAVIPDSSQNLAFALFGQVFGLWGASIAYWVGTTRSSSEKNRIIAQSEPVK
jgi:uncharacterized membrane protein (DUF106 family)